MSDVKMFLALIMLMLSAITTVTLLGGLGEFHNSSSVVHIDKHTCIVWKSGPSQSISCDWGKP